MQPAVRSVRIKFDVDGKEHHTWMSLIWADLNSGDTIDITELQDAIRKGKTAPDRRIITLD